MQTVGSSKQDLSGELPNMAFWPLKQGTNEALVSATLLREHQTGQPERAFWSSVGSGEARPRRANGVARGSGS